MTELLTQVLRRSIPFLLFAAVVGVFAHDGQAQPQPTLRRAPRMTHLYFPKMTQAGCS
jgi:hypothetical protein